jgi:hypothetical protein
VRWCAEQAGDLHKEEDSRFIRGEGDLPIRREF